MYRSSLLLQNEMQVKGQLRAATTLHLKQRTHLPLVRGWASLYGPSVQTKNLSPLSAVEPQFSPLSSHHTHYALPTPCVEMDYKFSHQLQIF